MNLPIINAVKAKQCLQFTYDDLPRLVEPHTYGINSLKHEVLVAFQIGGQSKSGKPIGWHTFSVEKIVGLQLTVKTFAKPRPEYKKGDTRMTKIFAEL